jgi:GTP cyclohydrolase I
MKRFSSEPITNDCDYADACVLVDEYRRRTGAQSRPPNFSAHPPGRDFNLVVNGFQLVLNGLGVKPGAHTEGTALRAAKAWWNELCSGLTQDPPKITTFPAKGSNMVVLRSIPIRSMCAHHLLPFIGEAVVAYIPGDGKILGLSKLSRIADYWARRPQVQEELTDQIADAVAALVTKGKKGGVGVLIRANHACMELRGVHHKGDMLTSALRGAFLKSEVRDEFLRLAGF